MPLVPDTPLKDTLRYCFQPENLAEAEKAPPEEVEGAACLPQTLFLAAKALVGFKKRKMTRRTEKTW